MSGSDHSSAPDEQGASTGSPPSIPGHQLLRPIARGSYGEIWLARTELGALRAVKIIRRANFSDARPYDREFAGIQRYEPISREHEGLVDVLQVGREEAPGFFYYVMELADDAAGSAGNTKSDPLRQRDSAARVLDSKAECPPKPLLDNRQLATGNWQSYAPLTLAQVIHQRQRLPASEVIELGIGLAQALDFLHSRRLVHRDVKPSNIIFVGGQPKLADVGLVADLGNPQSLVGTEGYIPPEGPGSAQADIYSLGKVLYEAATGKDRQQFPDLPTRLGEGHDDPGLPELNEVLLRACESNLRARYSSAAQMAADLQRLKAGQSLRARRARRRRRRFIATGLAVVGGLALVGLGLGAFIHSYRLGPRSQLDDYLGEFTGARFLLREDFDGPQLNTNLWTWGHADLGVSGEGQRSFQVKQSSGELVLLATAEQHPNSVGESVWVDRDLDLRQLGPCRIELELAVEATRGAVVVAISNTNAPPRDQDLSGVKLAEFDAYTRNESLTWPSIRLRIDLLPTGQAVVYRGREPLDKSHLPNLNALPVWRLRLFCFTATSKDFPPGKVVLRIRQVLISNKPKDKMKPELGDVVDVVNYGALEVTSIGFRGEILTLLVQDSDTACRLVPVELSAGRVAPAVPSEGKPEFSADRLIQDFVQCDSQLVGVRGWPGVLLDLTSTPPGLPLELKHPSNGRTINCPNGATFDGSLLWFIESDYSNKRFGLPAVDLKRGAITKSLTSNDTRMKGLAWGGRLLWISSAEGRVYAIDPNVAERRGTVEAGFVRDFRGNYTRLAYGQGWLWGLEPEKHRICKIKITD